MADRYALDAFALLALFQNEPGTQRVQEVLEGARRGEHEVTMSVVNLGEVMYCLQRRRGRQAARRALAVIEEGPIRLVDVDRSRALRAARLKAGTGMGYADCFAAALASELGATLLTGDRDFAVVESAISIDWLPSSAPGPMA